jgi:hypothetical protein
MLTPQQLYLIHIKTTTSKKGLQNNSLRENSA